MLLEYGSSMLTATQFYMGYFPETEIHPHSRAALLSCTFLPFSVSISSAFYLFLHHMLIIEHRIAALIMYRCGIGFVKTLSSSQTQLSSNELFGSQLTATNSLVLMTRHIREKGDKTKIKFLFQWPHQTGVLEHRMPSAI